VDWATFPENNATNWDSTGMDWASSIVDRASVDVFLLTRDNVDWANTDADWVTLLELYVTGWASVDVEWVTR
jgi:hypothetical protein